MTLPSLKVLSFEEERPDGVRVYFHAGTMTRVFVNPEEYAELQRREAWDDERERRLRAQHEASCAQARQERTALIDRLSAKFPNADAAVWVGAFWSHQHEWIPARGVQSTEHLIAAWVLSGACLQLARDARLREMTPSGMRRVLDAIGASMRDSYEDICSKLPPFGRYVSDYLERNGIREDKQPPDEWKKAHGPTDPRLDAVFARDSGVALDWMQLDKELTP